MDIVQEVSSISQQVLSASDVITNERKIETKVLAKDGDIVVLGGLVKDDVQDSQQGVPLLSDIPVLGRLFRSDVVSVTKSNLLVLFVLPLFATTLTWRVRQLRSIATFVISSGSAALEAYGFLMTA
jgi:general secretion pathway protein D